MLAMGEVVQRLEDDHWEALGQTETGKKRLEGRRRRTTARTVARRGIPTSGKHSRDEGEGNSEYKNVTGIKKCVLKTGTEKEVTTNEWQGKKGGGGPCQRVSFSSLRSPKPKSRMVSNEETRRGGISPGV